MSFFPDIESDLLARICEDYSKIYCSIDDLTDLLDVENYVEMSDTHQRSKDLHAKELELEKQLRIPLNREFPTEVDPEIIESLLTSYLVAGLYPDSVGPIEETATSIELVTFPMFKAEMASDEKRMRKFAELCDQFSIQDEVKTRMLAEVDECRVALDKRRALIDEIRKRVLDEDGSVVAKAELKKVFDLYFPGNPLNASEVDLIITRTCVYWSLPTKEELENRSAEALVAATEWLNYTNRFAFQYFSHFPTFSSFDARDSDQGFIDELCQALGSRKTDVIRQLNAATTIEKTPQIEKYLIHDTWGHIWQGDLTNLAQLYDSMESLKSPVDANEHLTLPSGNVVSLLDTTYLNRNGEVIFNEELATDYIDHWLRIRVRSLLAPIIAELTADVVEYKFKLDNADQRDLLPSSSIFAESPSKLDFAWVDIGYFIRTLKRINSAYSKNEELRENLIDRVVILLKAKYPRQYKSIESVEVLRKRVGEIVLHFCELIEARQNLHLDHKLANQSATEPNAFFLLFTNLLGLQFTLNHLIQNHLEPKKEVTSEAFNVLNLFVARYFTAQPLTNFWKLDQAVANYGLAFCQLVAEEEL